MKLNIPYHARPGPLLMAALILVLRPVEFLDTVTSVYASNAADSVMSAEPSTAVQHMDVAKKLMGSGQFFEALNHFEAAIGLDPSDYMLHFKQAAAYLTMGRYPLALAGFSKVLELRPEHTASRMQKTKILLLGGSISDAKDECERLRSDISNKEVESLIADIEAASNAYLESQHHLKESNCDAAVEPLSTLLSHTPLHYETRILRADCFLSLGDRAMAIGDYKKATKIKPDSTTLYLKLAALHLELGETGESIANSKECLRLDPDHSGCKKQFKRVKKLEKALKATSASAEKGRWRDVLSSLFDTEGDNLMEEIEKIGAANLKIQVYSLACKGHGVLRKDVDAINWCSKVLDLDSENVEALIARGNALMNKEDYREAITDFQSAYQHNKHDPRISEGYNKAQKLQKQAGMRNYYKTLGIQRTASKSEVRKAFRKLAQVWHPDKYVGELSKEDVQRKMSEINQAYEVLGNEELRERYDNGDDPNDQNQGGGGQDQFRGGNFFHQQGGFQFGGGQFKFNF
ncbi:hypothetical protein BASA60_008631 [Batrachochytrium salamandrivorans]|nr:hypothetical protein BASA60_008631 [Batrachochytrium salamandrivorans]KAH6574587.1 hypothetical protein BASA62_002386 [Batrachochytrium salamandrivorans]KAH9265917.1 hypothetical protein BASA84_001377 [Batrachochytrium salamandrivorans]